MKAFLDTHAAVALYEGDRSTFGRGATDLIERSAIFISPFVELELRFLEELGKIDVSPGTIVGGLVSDWGVLVADDPVQAIIVQAMKIAWTHDPFDRLLVATAMLHRSPLITRDQKVREHFADAVW